MAEHRPRPEERVRITEIFFSLQGESSSVGIPTTFVRLTGCPLRCGYCDTAYAFGGGQWMTMEAILEVVARHPTHHITVTGGEPLAQERCHALLRRLCDAGYRVSLETSGALPVERVDPRVVKVMDLKTPGSGEVGRNRYDNVDHLDPNDEVKFVICDRTDYEWARGQLAHLGLRDRCGILFSPCAGRQDPAELARWILEDGLPVRFQMQLHKLLWGDEPGR
ncbi:MAG: 7-carboxy-7-deazaguanine synthase QueE [Gammaproteobacteria bacterium]|nr:7-carboxy-7-deazaguanine synthase QueE [Gammaproteobacteria bacterium]